MEFIDIATEQTTAATDAIMGIMAIAAVVYLRKVGQHQPRKIALWMWVFGLLAVAGILGAIVHGLKMTEALEDLLWHPIYLSLGLVVAFFIVATAYDIWGEGAAQRVLPIMIAVGVGFFALTLVWPDSFLVFIIYEAVAMLFALGGYAWLGFHRFAGAWLMTSGVLVTIIAAGVQASGAVSFTLIWSFDYNGAYHLIQMIGIVLLVAGLRAALLSRVSIPTQAH